MSTRIVSLGKNTKLADTRRHIEHVDGHISKTGFEISISMTYGCIWDIVLFIRSLYFDFFAMK